MDSLRALVADIDAHLFPSLGSVVHGDTLADLLDQADSLVGAKGYLPAVMLAGGVLEAHLRYLAAARNLTVAKSSIGGLNEQLYAANVYPKAKHSLIATWANLRNIADHLNQTRVDETIALTMCVGVRSFISEHPA